MPDAVNSSIPPHHGSPFSLARPARWALAAAALAAGSLLAGCPPAPRSSSTRPMQTDLRNTIAPIIGNEPVAGGIYLSLGSYSPLSGAALARAMESRPEILKAVTATIPAATTQPATQKNPDTDPPPLAVKYYLEGREKFLDGANTEAMEYLEKALQLDPNAFTVLRLMGRVCFASSQLARGVLYLQKAQQQRPADVEVNYLLGRYWLERKDFDRAVYYLMQADDSPEREATSSQTPLVSFYLARAFQADGYHRAAAAEYNQFLTMVELPVPGYRYDRELNYLIEESWATHLAVAENDVLVGNYAAALPHYEAAQKEESNDPFVTSRLVNAEMHTGHDAAARASALELVSATKGADASLQLLAWVYRAEHRESQLIPDLRSRLSISSADDPAPTLTIAAALDYLGQKQEAFETLRSYLQAHPGNLDVLGRLLKRVSSASTFGQAIDAAAAAITAEPSLAEKVVELFTPIAQSAGATAYTASVNEGESAQFPPQIAAAARYLLAVAEEKQNVEPDAIDRNFRDALQLKPNFQPAREAYVSWLLSQEKYREASTLIRKAIDQKQGGAKAWVLLIDSEVAQQRYSNALQIANEAKKKFPDTPEIRLRLATVYQLRNQFDDADGVLSHAIDDFPKYEPAYIALINLRVQQLNDSGQGERDLNEIVKIVARLMREIPTSKFGQVTTATFYARAGRLDDAESLLRRLLIDNPDDPEVLGPLAQIRMLMGHPDDAVSLLEQSLQRHPQIEMARDLIALYRQQNKPTEALALADRLVRENPTNPEYTVLQASVLQSEKKTNDAIAALNAAVQRFPLSQQIAFTLARLQENHDQYDAAIGTWKSYMQRVGETPDRLYMLSHFYASAGNDDAVVSTLQRVLAMQPDHTGANNDLGYFWADEGIHLDQAEAMIRKAIENEPNKPAFLDSLGWLYYKEGKFKDAVKWLEKAVALPDGLEAEVAQHLGDALYRDGRKSEAIERWTQGQALLSIEKTPLPKEDQKVKDYLDRVTSAARAGREPALSPIATNPKPQSAGPTSLPENSSN